MDDRADGQRGDRDQLSRSPNSALGDQAIQSDIPIGYQTKAFLDSAFLVTYGLMYLGGGWLLDRIGTQRGFLIIMTFWSLACASHGFAGGVIALAASRLLLGVGEGGGFPAATRAIAEWFSPKDRASAMGVINAGTAVGAVVAPPLIALILSHARWFGLSSWRWVFFLTGALGIAWGCWWLASYRTPAAMSAGVEIPGPAESATTAPSLPELLRQARSARNRFREVPERRRLVFLPVLAAEISCSRLALSISSRRRRWAGFPMPPRGSAACAAAIFPDDCSRGAIPSTPHAKSLWASVPR